MKTKQSYRFISYLIIPALALTGCMFLTGCNTMEGVGQDVEKVGEEITEASVEAR